jgi:hypothetical protein
MASLTLSQRIKANLDRHNKLMAEGYPLIDPSASIEPAYQFGITEVIKTIADCDIPLPQGYFSRSTTAEVVDEIMRWLAGSEYDPWPELTKAQLIFLIGARLDTSEIPNRLSSAVHVGEDVPLTFMERVIAGCNRTVLLKGPDTECMHLANSSAEVAILTGKAA